MTRGIVVICFVLGVAFIFSVPGFSQGTCTRADLQAAVDSYLTAQKSGNPGALSLSTPAKYIENTVETTLDKSIVKSALKIDFSRSLLDTTICESFTEVIVTDASHPYVLGVRLKVSNRRIAELETLVTDADDWLGKLSQVFAGRRLGDDSCSVAGQSADADRGGQCLFRRLRR